MSFLTAKGQYMEICPAPEAIQCSICGRLIFDGDAIAFWSQHNMHNAPRHARVIIPHVPTRLHEAYIIGCTAHKCIWPRNRARGKFIKGQIRTFFNPHRPFSIIFWWKWLAYLKQANLPVPEYC